MGENSREKPASRLLWLSIGAVPGALLGLLTALIVGLVQLREPKLYYVVRPQFSARFGSSNCVFGTIELGNDGTAPMKDWSAVITFPPGVEVREFAPQCVNGVATMPTSRMSSSAYGAVRTLAYSSPQHLLNPDDSIEVCYLLSADGKPKVVFKGPGSTATERQPRERQGNLSWCILLAAVLGGAGGALIAFTPLVRFFVRDRRKELAVLARIIRQGGAPDS